MAQYSADPTKAKYIITQKARICLNDPEVAFIVENVEFNNSKSIDKFSPLSNDSHVVNWACQNDSGVSLTILHDANNPLMKDIRAYKYALEEKAKIRFFFFHPQANYFYYNDGIVESVDEDFSVDKINRYNINIAFNQNAKDDFSSEGALISFGKTKMSEDEEENKTTNNISNTNTSYTSPTPAEEDEFSSSF